ncbi:MAG TPA: hypothetical protein PLZ05_00070 [Alphaproteobacteria bacterium]|nr:hypothetical protein [Alphaproteobacteria bacterium]
MRIVLPYNIKKAYLFGLMALMGLASCSKKNDSLSEYDRLLKEYEAMQVDSANMAEAIKHYTDVELSDPSTQSGVKAAFWAKAVYSTPLPLNFADSVAGKKPDGTISGGYKNATTSIITQYGPSGTNELTAASIGLLNNIGSSSDTYLSFLTPIANKRLELLASQGK